MKLKWQVAGSSYNCCPSSSRVQTTVTIGTVWLFQKAAYSPLQISFQRQLFVGGEAEGEVLTFFPPYQDSRTIFAVGMWA